MAELTAIGAAVVVPASPDLRVLEGALTGSGGGLAFGLAPGGAPSVGSVTIRPDGSYTLVLPSGFLGQTSFAFRVTDPAGRTATATVSVTAYDGYINTPDQPASIEGTLGNDILVGGYLSTTLYGGEGNDTIWDQNVPDDPHFGRNVIFGGAGDDTLLGSIYAGNSDSDPGWADEVYGGEGNDDIAVGRTIYGGAGDDIYRMDGFGYHGRVIEAASGGHDTLVASRATLPANVEDLVLQGELAERGTGNALANQIMGTGWRNSLFGAGGDDTLLGLAGADLLDGGAGADRLVGGAGDDAYVVDGADAVVELAGGGMDMIRRDGSHTLASGAFIENLLLLGTGAWSGTGNVEGNRIAGNGAGNELRGLGGLDTLLGMGGADLLLGGDGDDRLDGGDGSDTLRGGAGADSLGGRAGDDALAGGLGDDRLDGGAGADTLRGEDGADTLAGGAGDQLEGGAGDDVYLVNLGGAGPHAVVAERPGGGMDEVRLVNMAQSATYALTPMVENVVVETVLPGSLFATVVGNALDNVMSAGDCFLGVALRGGNGRDTLIGGQGRDRLNGEAGTDRMAGGAGEDTYVVDVAGDVVVETDMGWADVVYAAVSRTIDANVETLVLTGAAALTGTGRASNDEIRGNAGDNILRGLDGFDTLWGGAGRDRLDGGAGADILTGEDGADALFGGVANDTLGGGAGDDALHGGAGADAFILERGRDVVADYGNGRDMLVFDDALWGGPNDEDEPSIGEDGLLGYGRIVNGDAVFDFGSHRFTIRGVDDLDDLRGELRYF